MNKLLWSVLLHLGGNMWNEEGNPRDREHDPDSQASPVLRFSRPLWRRYLDRLKACGVNMILLDLGEGLRYESHPELAVEGSWTRDEMAAELKVMQDMGYSTMLWSLALYDYDENAQPSVDEVVSKFNKHHFCGMMPLLHVISSADRKALPYIIQSMKKKGYRFGTVDRFTKKKSKKKAKKKAR